MCHNDEGRKEVEERGKKGGKKGKCHIRKEGRKKGRKEEIQEVKRIEDNS